MSDFLTGLVTMGYLTAGLFFLKFWRRTRDGLFAAFSIAFGLLALEQVLLLWSGQAREESAPLYLMRFFAFLFIIAAIVRKNSTRA